MNYNSSSAKEGAIRILNASIYFGTEYIWQLMRYNDGIPCDIKTVYKFIKNKTISKLGNHKKEEEARWNIRRRIYRREKDRF